MKYYRVKEKYDNKPLFKFHRGGGLEIMGFVVKNELYTPSEIKKYCGLCAYCELVEIPKNKIDFSSGKRFLGV
jgi:hypothetical protein